MKKDEKGFILVESLTALTVVTLALSIYAPSAHKMLEKITENQRETEMFRVLLESSRSLKDDPFQNFWSNEQDGFYIEYERDGDTRRMTIKDGDKTEQIRLLDIPNPVAQE